MLGSLAMPGQPKQKIMLYAERIDIITGYIRHNSIS